MRLTKLAAATLVASFIAPLVAMAQISKNRYEGGFRDGHITGYCIYTKADGRRFEGRRDDMPANQSPRRNHGKSKDSAPFKRELLA